MNCVLFAEIYQAFSLKKKKHYKILENGGKYWKSPGTLLVQKSGKPWFVFPNVKPGLQSEMKTFLLKNNFSEN